MFFYALFIIIFGYLGILGCMLFLYFEGIKKSD